MTTLIFDWSELLGRDATGVVRVRATRWRHEPETLVVPWSRDLRFTGREVLEMDAGLVLSVEWRPDGVADSLTQTLVVPAEGEHFAHLLAVDPSTLEPLEGDDLVTAADLMARAESLVTRIEGGEFTGAAGVGVESITDDDGDGVATVRLTSGVESSLPLPRGPQGERGERGLTGERGDTGPSPEVYWSEDRLTVGGQTGPSLTGPQGDKGERGATGPATTLTIGTVTDGATAGATLTGEAPEQTLSLVLPQGAKGDRGPQGVQGPPGVVSSASSYVIVGPGRPDQPSTTAGTITGSEPVGAEYRSTDGAGVGAFVWTKRPGGKWEVTDGDTGWRAIFNGTTVLESTWAPITAPSYGRLRLRRTAAGLWVSADDIQFPSGTTTQFSMLGGLGREWQVSADSYTYPGGFYVLGGQQPALRVDRGDLVGTPVGGRIRDIKFYPSSSWPTTLPGSPT